MWTRNLLLAACVFLFPAAAHGELILSNLGQGTASGATVGYFFSNTQHTQAQAFTTGSNPGGYSLNSVTIDFHPSLVVDGRFTLSLFSESSNDPDSLIASLSGDENPVGNGHFTYTASGVILSPLTSYFVVADVDESVAGIGVGSYTWRSTTTQGQTSVDGWTVGDDSRSSHDNGAGWNTENRTLGISVDATAVPEASVTLVWSVLTLGVALKRRRRMAA